MTRTKRRCRPVGFEHRVQHLNDENWTDLAPVWRPSSLVSLLAGRAGARQLRDSGRHGVGVGELEDVGELEHLHVPAAYSRVPGVRRRIPGPPCHGSRVLYPAFAPPAALWSRTLSNSAVEYRVVWNRLPELGNRQVAAVCRPRFSLWALFPAPLLISQNMLAWSAYALETYSRARGGPRASTAGGVGG